MTESILTRVRAARHERAPEAGPTPDPVHHDMAEQARFAEWLESLRTELAQSLNGAVLRGARPYAITAGKSARPVASADSLMGWSVRESTGAAAAVLVLHDGPDATASELASITLSAGESTRDWFGPGGINIGEQGLYVEAVSGSVVGSIYLGGPS